MATIPTPRSYNQIMGDMINAFLSRFGIKSLRVGSPILAMLEAAAQSDLRNSQDIFNLLNSDSLDRATGIALDRKGADEDTPRLSESAANGLVNVSDTSFLKISTKVYQGSAAPIIGTTALAVADASSFPATGRVYIGRNTTNYEGPINYTATTNSGTFWTITLQTGTTKFHNVGESVILAQGGNRSIPAGTLVQTAQGNVQEAIQFSVLQAATIPDGEISITGVGVVAKKTGVIGNVPAKAINQFASQPFNGAAVNNALPFTNAQSAEDDDTYRARIKNVKQSRSKGTPLAIKTAVLGITSTDDNKRVTSASVVTRQSYPTTLYIDDGTGYEERWSGNALETIVDSAFGGEQFLQVAAKRPITKAFAKTLLSAPYAIPSGSKLAVKVGGVLYLHTFSASDFRTVGSATVYEVVASINADPLIQFGARTSDSGTTVTIYAKKELNESDEDEELNESIEVVVPGSGVDANTYLSFPLGRNDTIKLYKNDKLLAKDGTVPTILSAPQSAWAQIPSGSVTLTIAVDGTAATTYTINDSDFLVNNTGYSLISQNNSVTAWCAVLNAKIPGVTATPIGNQIQLTSNLGPSTRSSLVISGGTLVTFGVFSATYGLSATGTATDYTFNRNTGQIFLGTSLTAGDSLTAGSLNTRAFLQSATFTTFNLLNAAKWWFVVDGAATPIAHGVTSLTLLTSTNPSGNRMRWTATGTGSSTAFSNILSGDWVIFWDTGSGNNGSGNLGFTLGNQNAWRVAYATGNYFEIERSSFSNQTNITLPQVGLSFVRTTQDVQLVGLGGGTNYTPTSLVSTLSNLVGATIAIYKGTRVRVYTNSYSSSGDVALVAQNTDAAGTGLFTTGSFIPNLTSHVASVESGTTDYGTPWFCGTTVCTSSGNGSASVSFSPNVNTINYFGNVTSGQQVLGLRDRASSGSVVRSNNAKGHNSIIASRSTGSIFTSSFTLRNPAVTEIVSGLSVSAQNATIIPTGRISLHSPLAIAPQDAMTVVVDNDPVTKRYSVNMYRRLRPTTGTYSATQVLRDLDNGNTTLANTFGLNFNWQDFAIHMKARAKTHDSTTSAVLWRYYLFGQGGDKVRMRYEYPIAPSTSLTEVVDAVTLLTSNTSLDVRVRLPSGSARSVPNVRSTTGVGLAAASGTLNSYYFIVGYSISTATRTTNVVVATLTLPFTLTDHGLQIGDTVYFNDTNGAFSSAAVVITARSATTITFTLNGADVGATGTPGTISMDTAGEASFTTGGSTAAVGDIIIFNSTSTLTNSTSTSTEAAVNGQTATSYVGKAMRINSLASQAIRCSSDTLTSLIYPGGSTAFSATNTTPMWRFLGSASDAMRVYPLASNTASAIATASQSLSGAFVIGTAVGGGSGTITQASWEENNSATFWVSLVDATNYVASVSLPATLAGDYTFTFKDSVNGTLSGGSGCDWANEELRITPATVDGVVKYLNTTNLTGLNSVASIQVSASADKVQLFTQTAGSTGAIQVASGTANSATAAIQGAGGAVGITGLGIVQINTSDIGPFLGDHWVSLTNTVGASKTSFALSGVYWNQITAAGLLQATTGSTPVWSYGGAGGIGVFDTQYGFFWQVEKQGKFVAYTCVPINGNLPAMDNIAEGDIVAIDAPQTWVANQFNIGPAVAGNVFIRPTANNGHYYKMTANSNSGSLVAGTGSTEPTWSLVGGTNADGVLTWTDQGLDQFPALSTPNQGFYRVVRVDHNRTTLSGNNSIGTSTFTVASTAGFVPGMTIIFEPWTSNSEVATVNAVLNTTQFSTVINSTKAHNQGFTVHGFNKTFWIENPNAVEEIGSANVTFFNYQSSALSGDTITLSPTDWGTPASGPWTVKRPAYRWGDGTNTRSVGEIILDTTVRTGVSKVIAQAAPTNLTTLFDPNPIRLIKQIYFLSPNTSVSTQTNVRFTSSSGMTFVSAALGTVMTGLDKLNFPTTTVTGVDAYSNSTGLIGEANRVIYGDDQNPSTYPGVVAAGSIVAISGPVVKRVQVSFSIRVRTGVTTSDVTDKVKNAVAGVINNAGIGQAIAISDLVNAAGSVTGVIAVSVISPTYNNTNDLISVQPYEKPLVQNLDTDVLVTIVGS
jgi:uncharacterized phage protein gp47/JayE